MRFTHPACRTRGAVTRGLFKSDRAHCHLNLMPKTAFIAGMQAVAAPRKMAIVDDADLTV